jgi:muramoyltetrapeptide carboxypeptidase
MPITYPRATARGNWKSKNSFIWEPYTKLPDVMNRFGNFRRISRWKFINLYSLLGSTSAIDCTDKILFIDLDEYLYHIDRMMMNLKRNGCLKI